MMEQEVRMNVNDGGHFFADEASVIHNPVKMVLDFKSVTPRIDISSQGMRVVMVHNTVAMEPYLAKDLAKVLNENIKTYEKKFGQIIRPKSLGKIKKFSGAEKKNDKADYFG